MPDRLRQYQAKYLLKTPFLVAVGLLSVYLLFGWFGFEPLVKWAAPKYLADKSGHRLSVAAAEFDPLALSLRLGGLRLTEPDGKPLLAFDELYVDFEAASLLKWAWTFETIRLTAPRARVELLPGGRLNWSALIEAFRDEEKEEGKPLPRLLIRRIALDKGRVEVADRRVGFETALRPLDLVLTQLSTLPEDKGAYTLAATTQVGARIRWKGDLILEPLLATGRVAVDRVQLARAWPYLDARLDMAPPEGQAALSLDYRVGWANKQLSLELEKLSLLIEKLALRSDPTAAPALALDRIALSGGRFNLGKRRLDIGAIDIRGGHVRLVRTPSGRLDVQDWFAPAEAELATAKPAPEPKAGAPSPSPRGGGEASGPPWRVTLARFALDGLDVHLTDQGFARPLGIEVANLRIGLRADASAGSGTPQLRVEDIGVDVSGVRMLSGQTPLVLLGGVTLEDGQVDLAGRDVRIERVALLNGRLEAERDAQGHIALLDAFRPAEGRPVPPPSGQAPAGTGWKFRVARTELAGFALAARDHGINPAAALDLERIEASVEGLSQDLEAALPVKLAFRVRQGGQFEATGKFVPASGEADVRLKLSGLALRTGQPYLSQASHLVLAGGRASTAGRLQYRNKGLRYTGGFRVDELLVNEASTGDRFLSWKALATDELLITQTGLDIGDLRLDRMGMKLIIYPDRTTNLKKAFQKGAPAETPALVPADVEITPDEAAPGSAAAAPAAKEETPPAAVQSTQVPAAKKPIAAPSFKVNIDRVRVDQGEMDFADLSLALPFSARIHELKGGINGITTQPGARAQLELDGRVDEYGLARAVGELDMFDPTDFLDIKVIFQNVEMTRLTPYTATFVGRRIDSGKLSLDLDYKIKQRQLAGENQIVMNRLVLGERVESPKAKDLPLDLAIAILQDSNGVIDLGLPVSGSLDDPKFSYGRIIWKAIANVIVKLATAPFRALGKLLGLSGEKLDKVAFEPGDAELLPPEKEKLKRLAEALGKRPGLALTVRGTYAPEAERPVLKERLLRRQVTEKMGIKLAEGEEAGPVSTHQPKTRTALEALYAERFGAEALKALQAKHAQANPEKKEEGAAGKLLSRLTGLLKEKPKPLSEAEAAELKGVDLHELFYRRLLDKVEVSDAQLAVLGQARGEAIARQLTVAGVPAERIKTEPAEKVEAEGREVVVKLTLGTARKAATEAAQTAPVP